RSYDRTESSTHHSTGHRPQVLGQENPGRSRPRTNRQAGTESCRDARGTHPRGTRACQTTGGSEAARSAVTTEELSVHGNSSFSYSNGGIHEKVNSQSEQGESETASA